jgi:hypothetical protein
MIRRAALEVEGVVDVQENFSQVLERPFCEILSVLAPFRERAEKSGLGLKLNPNKGCGGTYYAGEDLIVTVSATQPLEYVYVDQYTAHDEVVHLLPESRRTLNSFPENSSITIGGGDTQWAMASTSGKELLTVVTAAKQLFGQPHLHPESAQSYLDELRASLRPGAESPAIAAGYCFVTTAEEPVTNP